VATNTRRLFPQANPIASYLFVSSVRNEVGLPKGSKDVDQYESRVEWNEKERMGELTNQMQ
jgi:hypothetical protein